MIEFFIINNQLAVLVEYMNKNGKYSLVFAIFIACILLTGVAVAEKKGGGGGGGGGGRVEYFGASLLPDFHSGSRNPRARKSPSPTAWERAGMTHGCGSWGPR